MAITCPQCGAEYDVTLFTFDRRIRCDCGAWVDLSVGHQRTASERRERLRPTDVFVNPSGHDHQDGKPRDPGPASGEHGN